MYKTLLHTMPTEKFIIARNRDAGEWLERCFEVKDEKDRSEDDKNEDSNSTSSNTPR